MQVSTKAVQVLLVVVALAFLAVMVWPTLWVHYDGGILVGDQVVPIRVRMGRFTGKVQYLTLDGFKDPVVSPAPAAAVPGPGMAPSVPPAPATNEGD